MIASVRYFLVRCEHAGCDRQSVPHASDAAAATWAILAGWRLDAAGDRCPQHAAPPRDYEAYELNVEVA